MQKKMKKYPTGGVYGAGRENYGRKMNMGGNGPKCPCIREAMRKKYGERSIACCAKQEISTTSSDIIKKGISTASSILKNLTGGSGSGNSGTPKRDLQKNKVGGVAKYKHGGAWTRRQKGSGRCM